MNYITPTIKLPLKMLKSQEIILYLKIIEFNYIIKQ